MQKVVGSSPISRSIESPAHAGFSVLGSVTRAWVHGTWMAQQNPRVRSKPAIPARLALGGRRLCPGVHSADGAVIQRAKDLLHGRLDRIEVGPPPAGDGP